MPAWVYRRPPDRRPQRPTALSAAAAGVSFSVGVLTVTVEQPASTATGGASHTDTAQSLQVVQPASTATGGASFAASTFVLQAVQPAATATGGASHTASAFGLQAVQPTPTVTGGASHTDTVQSVAVVQPAATATGGASFTSTAQSVAVVLNTPTVDAGGGTSFEVSVLSLPVVQPAATATGAASFTDVAHAVPVAQPPPTVTGGSVYTGTVQSVAAVQPAAAAAGGASFASSPALATPVVQPASTVTGGAAHTASAFNISAAQPAVTVVTGSSVTVAALGVAVALPPPLVGVPSESFVFDSFADANGTLLQNHTGEVGATWAKHPNYGAGDSLITDGRLRGDGVNIGFYYASGLPPDPNYNVTASVRVFTDLAGGQTGVIGRLSPTAETYYYAIYNQATMSWELWKAVDQAYTQLGAFSQALNEGSTYALMLKMQADQISLVVDGVTRVGPVTDTSITEAGRAGLYTYLSQPGTGLHLEDFNAEATGGVWVMAPALTLAADLLGAFVPSSAREKWIKVLHFTGEEWFRNFCQFPTIESATSGPWSSPTTWDLGRVPQTGDVVAITGGKTVTYDRVTTDVLACVGVESGGHLTFRTDINTRLTVTNLMVFEGGSLTIGTAAQPVQVGVTAAVAFDNINLDLSLTSDDPEQHGGGLLCFGNITVHGAEKTTFERLGAEVFTGQNTITLSAPVSGWRVGDLILLPDSRQLPVGERHYPNFEFQQDLRDLLTVQSVSGDGLTVTFTGAAANNHLGARSTGNYTSPPEILPHAANLTRNVKFLTVPTSPYKGHTLYSHHARVSIRYAEFIDLGRSLENPAWDTTFDFNEAYPDGRAATFIGTNQRGRYAAHVHHCHGPGGASVNGYVFELVGNSFHFGGPAYPITSVKWPITVHGSSFGLLRDNVVFNAGGSGCVQENANEYENLWDHNFVYKVVGGAPERDNNGSDGFGFWCFGTFSRFTNNVAARCVNRYTFHAYGFAYTAQDLAPPSDGSVPIHVIYDYLPLFPGAHLTNPEETWHKHTQHEPIHQFEDNEAYSCAGGVTAWNLGVKAEDDQTEGYTGSVVKNFRGWHNTNTCGIFLYLVQNMVVDGMWYRGDMGPLMSAPGESSAFGDWGAGVIGTDDYWAHNVSVRNCDLRGTVLGIECPPNTSGGTMLVEHCTLQNASDVVAPQPWNVGAAFHADGPNVKVLRGNLHLPLPAEPHIIAAGTPKTPVYWEFLELFAGGQSSCVALNTLTVYNFNRVPGDSFKCYRPEQFPNFITPYTHNEGDAGGIWGAPFEGNTNAFNLANYGVCVFGEIITPAAQANFRSDIGLYADATRFDLFGSFTPDAFRLNVLLREPMVTTGASDSAIVAATVFRPTAEVVVPTVAGDTSVEVPTLSVEVFLADPNIVVTTPDIFVTAPRFTLEAVQPPPEDVRAGVGVPVATLSVAVVQPPAVPRTFLQITPAPLSAAAVLPPRTVNGGSATQVTAQTMVADLRSAVANTTSGVVELAPVQAVAVVTPAPSAAGQARVNVPTLSVTVTTPAVTVKTGARASVGAFAPEAQLNAVTVRTGLMTSVGVLSVQAALPFAAVEVGGGASVMPTVLSLAAAQPPPVAKGSASFASEEWVVQAFLPTPAVRVHSSVTPAAQALASSLPAVTAVTGAAASPQTFSLTAALLMVSEAGGATAVAPVLSLAAVQPTPVAEGSLATAAPAQSVASSVVAVTVPTGAAAMLTGALTVQTGLMTPTVAVGSAVVVTAPVMTLPLALMTPTFLTGVSLATTTLTVSATLTLAPVVRLGTRATPAALAFAAQLQPAVARVHSGFSPIVRVLFVTIPSVGGTTGAFVNVGARVLTAHTPRALAPGDNRVPPPYRLAAFDWYAPGAAAYQQVPPDAEP
jgi:hypothetical protein